MIKQAFLILFIAVLAVSCKKEEPTPEPAVEENTDNDNPGVNTLFVKGKIDNTQWTAIELQNGCKNDMGHTVVLDEPNDTITVDYASSFHQDAQVSQITAPLNGKLYLKMSNFKHSLAEYYDSDFLFHETFQVGNQTFAADSTTRGAEIVYVDNNQVEWSTKRGNQTGSSVVFTTIKNETLLNGDKVKIVRGIFSGKVYNPTGNSFKMVSNGSFYLMYSKY